MGTGKKEAARRERQGQANKGLGNVKVKGENFYRDAKKVKTLKRLNDGKPQRDSSGKITKAAAYQSKDIPNARVEPHRKWFTNSRVISQSTLSAFRDAIAEKTSDPNTFLLKSNKLPISLIRDDETKKKNGLRVHKAKMVIEASSFGDTFGSKAQRKRVKTGISSFEDLAGESLKMHDTYLERQEEVKLLSGLSGHQDGNGDLAGEVDDGTLSVAREPIFSKGQSKRIWNELYKVIDSSDVIAHVLDARDPLGTRCRAVEKYLTEEAPHKHLVFILNKCDLVPTSVAATWVRQLSLEHPTLAFHASITNSFGKGSLIALLRQFSILHSNRKQISVGFIGYPNAGKSSIINTLRKKAVCKTCPVPGETKVWQFVTLTRRVYLIDCPGVVPPNPNDSDEELLLRGVVRVENVENPSQYINAVLRRCQRKHLERTYSITSWKDDDDFLEILARKSGRLLKGGEPDIDGVARMVIHDFLRGRLPWYMPPPPTSGVEPERIDGREGKLGEITAGVKRKRSRGDGGDEVDANEPLDPRVEQNTDITSAEEDDSFDGFEHGGDGHDGDGHDGHDEYIDDESSDSDT